MNKKVTISLSALIFLLLLVIAAGVFRLYRGIEFTSPVAKVETDRDAVTETMTSDDDGTKPEDSENVSDAEKEVEGEADSEKKEAEPAPKSSEFAVTNCATGKKNTLRQNKDNSIELINENGKSLWKRSMPAQWGGAVGEVDYYSNKKIQFLIVAGKQVYLLDRLGRDVKGFPRPIPFEGIDGPLPVSTEKGKFWKIDTAGGPIYLTNKANEILTQLP